MFFALGNILFLLCSSHLFLAIILDCFGALNFHSFFTRVCGGGGGGGEEKQEIYEIYKRL